MLDDVSQEPYTSAVAGFTKLFSSLIFSTVWREDLHVKVVWITMLAMANRHGEVTASIPGLADAARVTIPQCEDALARFAAPDRYSRTKENEGRRIRDMDDGGGWVLLNYPKYRDLRHEEERRTQTREAVRRHRAKKASSLTVSRVSPGKPVKAEAEADTEADTTNTNTARSRANWVRRLGTIWRNRYHGTPPWGQIGKLLLPVRDEPELDYRFTAYLAVTDPQFVNLAKFVASFGSWGNGKKRPQTYTYEPGHSGPEL